MYWGPGGGVSEVGDPGVAGVGDPGVQGNEDILSRDYLVMEPEGGVVNQTFLELNETLEAAE